MKKITTLLMVVAFVFLSCETEPLNSDDVNGVTARGKVKKESSSADDCTVNLLPDLPATADACAKAKPGAVSYFDLSIADGPLAGDYAAWCVDILQSLDVPDCFTGDVYSSYDKVNLPLDAVDFPDNFDLVNWILNQDFVGKPNKAGDYTYTLGDVQWAMWELIDSYNDCVGCDFSNLVPYDSAKAQEIVDEAILHDGYEPTAGGVLAVVLIPNTDKQVVIIPFPLECEPEPECETAFARGTDGNTCFLDATPEFSRWGWTIGPLAEGVHGPYEIWAAAGQCETDKGELVGHVKVSYGADGVVDFDYTIIDGYTLSEVHEYAGNEMFPTKNGNPTVAPGQYTIADDLEGDIYVIWHAGVCK